MTYIAILPGAWASFDLEYRQNERWLAPDFRLSQSRRRTEIVRQWRVTQRSGIK